MVTRRVPSALVSQFAWMTVGRVAAALLQAGLLLLLARSVSPAQLGAVSAALGGIFALHGVLDLGLAKLIVKERAVAPDGPLLSGALRMNEQTSVTVGAISGSALLLLAVAVDPLFLLMLPLCLWAACEKNTDALLGVAVADGDARGNMVNLVGRRAAALLLFGLATGVGWHPVLAYSAALAASAVVALWAVRRSLRAVVGRRLVCHRRSVLAASAPYWGNTLAMQLRNADTLVAALVAGPVQGGLYSAASRLVSPLGLVASSLATIVLPHAARGGAQSPRALLRVILGLTAASGIAFAGLAAAAPWFVPLVLGAAYRDAVTGIQVIVLSLPFVGLSAMLGALLQGRGDERYVAWTAGVGTACCLVGVALAGWTHGAIGAALAYCAAAVLQSALTAGRYRYSAHHRLG